MKGTAKSIFSLFGAMAVGVAVLLMAPQKGTKLRKKIKKRAGNWMEGAKQFFPRNNSVEDVEEKSAMIVPVT